jgi:thiol-disulfide isomerase/thioredoxin
MRSTRLTALFLFTLLPGPSANAADKAPTAIKGVVEDDAGEPVAGLTVEARTDAASHKATTDAEGRFEVKLPDGNVTRRYLLCSTADGRKRAYFASHLTADWQKQPIRLRLKPVRRLEVRVADAAEKPVADAGVVVLAGNIVVEAKTDAAGKATCLIPADTLLRQVWASKGGRGFDYTSVPDGEEGKGAKAVGHVSLTLSGAEKVTIRLIDADGKPLAGVPLSPTGVRKTADKYALFVWSAPERYRIKTDGTGVAFFDMPRWQDKPITFAPDTKTHVHDPFVYDAKTQKGPLTLTLHRLVPLRGRVTFADGKPAPGIPIRATGWDHTYNHYDGTTKTDAAGGYELRVDPHKVYLVAVVDGQWGSAPRTGFAVFPDKPVKDIDFRLVPATRIHGRFTMGADKEPQAKQRVGLLLRGKRPEPAVEFPGHEKNARMIHYPQMSRTTVTDEDGRYEIFAGPGEYQLAGPRPLAVKNFEVKDEKTLVFDFHAERAARGPLRGLVVTGDPPKPVAGAEVEGESRSGSFGGFFNAKTDAEGRFVVNRMLAPTVVIVRHVGKRLAASVAITADAATVKLTLQPMVTARGRLVDIDGEPLTERVVQYGTGKPGRMVNGVVDLQGEQTKTDGKGYFELTRLVIGVRYAVRVPGGFNAKVRSPHVAGFEVKDAKPIDLGDVAVKLPESERSLAKRTAEAFLSSAPPSDQFASAALRAKLCQQRVLLVFVDPKAEETQKLFKLRFDAKMRNTMYSYLVVPVPVEGNSLTAAQPLAKDRKVSLENRKFPLLVVCDADGKQLAISEFAPLSTEAKLTDFLTKHAPETLDARKVLADALARAKKENKRVFVQQTATWCGPCYRLSLFLDAQRAAWSKDYVWVKIDERWTHAAEVMKDIRKGADGGIPWYAILDADGKVLATCNNKAGKNVGFPDEAAGIDHLVGMFKATAIRSTAADIAALRKALEKR